MKTTQPVVPLIISLTITYGVGHVLGESLFEFLQSVPGVTVFLGIFLVFDLIFRWIDHQTGDRYQWELWSSSNSQVSSGTTESVPSSNEEDR